jgi:hypothetical protein
VAKKRKFKFKKGAVGRNSAKQSQDSKYGYLNLPKGMSMFKEEPGSRVSLDIIPYVVQTSVHADRDDEYGTAVPGALWYKVPFKIHRNIGANKDTIVCPTTFKKPCPICEQRAQLIKDGVSWDDDAVKAIKPSNRNLYFVVPKGTKDYNEKVHVWDMSKFLFQDKLDEEIQENEEYDTFPDLEEGYTLRIRFSEESFGSNKFASTSRIDFVERKKPYDESILDDLPCLENLLEVKPYKVIEALFFGNLSPEEAEEEVDKPKPKGGQKNDPSDDDDDDDTGEEETKKNRRRPEPDDEEEDDEDGDSGDDEASTDDGDDGEGDDEEEATYRKKRQNVKKKKGKEDKPTCPYGHRFGEDIDDYDDCNDCDLWGACIDASDS